MLYVIYNKETDIDELVTEGLIYALEEAGRILDRTDEPEAYQVFIIDLTEDSYDKHDWSYVSKYVRVSDTLKRFIDRYGIDDVSASESKPDISDKNWEKMNNTDNEYLKNLDEHEQLQVLHFIPDQMLIDELNRRIDEYRKYADAIREAGEELMIYV